jgi:hypothetical protein
MGRLHGTPRGRPGASVIDTDLLKRCAPEAVQCRLFRLIPTPNIACLVLGRRDGRKAEADGPASAAFRLGAMLLSTNRALARPRGRIHKTVL